MTEAEAKVIVNPVASGGKVGQRWPALRALLRQAGFRFAEELTEAPRHATEIASRALDEGFRYFVAVGGDGTVHEVVNGLVRNGRFAKDVVLSIIPGGTGADYVRSVGISRDPDKAYPTVLGQTTRKVDVGEILCIRDGQPVHDYFVNVAGLGFDGETCVRVNRMSKRISGTLPYLTGLVMTLVSYRNKDVKLTFNGQHLEGRFNSVIVCNGQYFGGGMWVGPQAVPDDGIFDVVILGNLNKPEFLWNVPRVYKGTHLTHPKVQHFQARSLLVESAQPMFIQAEGELVGEAPAEFRMLPAALNLRV